MAKKIRKQNTRYTASVLCIKIMRERHIAWRRAMRGDQFDLGPQTRVRILAPELPLITGTSSDINNGHHGIAYSSTPAFLIEVGPKPAIISCGLHNVFSARRRCDASEH